MKKPRQSKLDPLKIYMNAERFRLADNYLRSSANPDIEFRQIIGLPALVICAFAAELYLKCLLCIETGNAPATHNLKALFRDLGHTTRFRVENLWKERLPLQAGTFEIMERVTGRAPPRDFASALDAGAQAFVDLRQSTLVESKNNIWRGRRAARAGATAPRPQGDRWRGGGGRLCHLAGSVVLASCVSVSSAAASAARCAETFHQRHCRDNWACRRPNRLRSSCRWAVSGRARNRR
jgi:hypothetical protein